MAAPFLIPAGMMAVKIGGKWILKKIAKRKARKKVLSPKTKKAILKKATKQEKKRLKEKATPPFKEYTGNKKWEKNLALREDEFSGTKPLNPKLKRRLEAHTAKKRKRVNKLTTDAKRRRSGSALINKLIMKTFKGMDKGKLMSMQKAGDTTTRSAEVSAPTNLGRRKPKTKGRRKEDKKKSSKQTASDVLGESVKDRAYDRRKTTRRKGQGNRKGR